MLLRRYVKLHASTVTLGAIFLFFSVLVFLTLCTTPCEHSDHQQPGRHDRKNAKAFLVIIIMTGPPHGAQRDTLRQTWLSQPIPGVTHLFPIGTGLLTPEQLETLNYEESHNHDLLLLPRVNDTYGTLTSKLLASLQWVEENMEYAFIMKADDDTYVRLDVIEMELREMGGETGKLYWGFFDGRANVKQHGKWAEPKWVLCDTYLPYARGGGYVLGAKLVSFIVQSADMLKLYKSEDASLGAWLAPVKVNRVHDPRFDTEYKSRGCNNKYIVTHKQDRTNLIQKHRNLNDLGKLCTKEFRTRYSYVYNWKVPPSKCCTRNDTSVP